MHRAIASTLSLLLLAICPALAQEAAPVAVTVTAKGCEPNALTVKAGRVTFVITNRSSRALEWEILKGVMIVDERENIAPGFKQRLSTTLEPGEYAVTCGLLSNPRGKLVVLNARGGTDAAAAKPSVSELVGLSAEYRVWTASQLAMLAKPAERRAIRDVVLRLTPLNALAKSQAEALETALASGSADLAAPAGAYAEALRKVSVAPQALLDGLAAMATALVTADPADAAALLVGIEDPAIHVLALVRRADPALADDVAARLATTRAALRGEGAVKDAAAALAGSLAKLSAALGTS